MRDGMSSDVSKTSGKAVGMPADYGADDLVRLLNMQPHPEGGYYAETFRDEFTDANGRAASTLIYFLLQEGILSLMQLPRTTVAVNLVKEAGLPYIVVQTDPTTGGVSASYAMLGDIHISEPNATIGFAGKRVIEQTIREKLPDSFQTAEYLLEHGMLDLVVHRSQMKLTLSRVLRHLLNRGPAPEGAQYNPLPLQAPEASNTPTDSASTGGGVEPPSPLLSTP